MAHGDPNWQVSVREHIESDESFVIQEKRFNLAGSPPMWTTEPRHISRCLP